MVKKLLLRLYYWPFSSKDKIEEYQKRIRDEEWKAIIQFIPSESNFLDIGCGAGYALLKAHSEKNCICTGVDPEPGMHGYGRFQENTALKNLPIIQGYCETMPFAAQSFDVVFSSHMLEHSPAQNACLKEIRRVAKDDGVIIIGVPTAAMAWINWISRLLFTTHTTLVNLLLRRFITTGQAKWIHLLFPPSHSFPDEKTILYDVNHYRISVWKKLIGQEFQIEKVLKPCLYPYPDFVQWLPFIKNFYLSSSVFFVCRKKV